MRPEMRFIDHNLQVVEYDDEEKRTMQNYVARKIILVNPGSMHKQLIVIHDQSNIYRLENVNESMPLDKVRQMLQVVCKLRDVQFVSGFPASEQAVIEQIKEHSVKVSNISKNLFIFTQTIQYQLLNYVKDLEESEVIDVNDYAHYFKVKNPENTINLLIYFIQKRQQKSMKELVIHNYSINDQSFDQNLKDLEEQLSCEERLTNELKSLISKCRSAWKSKQFQELKSLLFKVRQAVTVVDIFKIRVLHERVEDQSFRLQGKNVVLLIGYSGVGKSTLVHYLAGSKMIETTLDGITHIGPGYIENEQAKQILNGPNMFSVTKFIQPVDIKFPALTLCDTPGFGDTQGVEVDIVNSLGIVKAASKCKSIRPVIVISSKSTGDRLSDLFELFKTIGKMFTSLEDSIDTFSYIMTKFNHQDQQSLPHLISEYLSRLHDNEKSDQAFKTLITDFERKAKDNKLIFVDPLKHDQASSILYKLSRTQEFSQPSYLFKTALSKHSENALLQQLLIHQKSLQTLLTNNHLAEARHKLDDIKFLQEILNMDEVRNIYDQAVSHIITMINQKHQRCKAFNDHAMDLKIMQTQEDISRYMDDMEQIRELSDAFADHIDGGQKISDSLQELLAMVRSKLQEFKLQSQSTEEMLRTFKKLHSLSQGIQTLKPTFQEYQTDISSRIIKELTQFQEYYENNKSDTAALIYKNIEDQFNTLKDYLEPYVSIELQKIQENFLAYCNKKVKSIQTSLEDTYNLKEDSIAQIIDDYQWIQTFLKDFHTFSLFQRHLQVSKSTIESHITDYLTQLQKQIFKHSDADNLFKQQSNIGIFLKFQQCLQSNAITDLKVIKILHETNEKLKSTLESIKYDVQDAVDKYFNKDDDTQLYRLQTLTDQIQKGSGWIGEVNPEFIKNMMEFLTDKVKDKVQGFKSEIQKQSKMLDNIEHYQDHKKLLKRIESISTINNIGVSLGTVLQDIKETFEHKEKELLDSIKDLIKKLSDLNKQPGEYSNLIKGLQFLGNYKNHQPNDINERIEDIIKVKDDLIRTYLKKLASTLEDKFNAIEDYDGSTSVAKEQLIKDVELIEVLLQQIEYFTKESTIFANNTDNILMLTHWEKDKLGDLAEKLSQDLMAEIKIDFTSKSVEHKIHLVHALIKLDRFNQGRKFKEVHREARILYNTRAPQIQQDLKQMLKTKDFKSMFQELQKLNTQQVHQIEQHIVYAIEKLKDKTKSLLKVTRNLKYVKEDIVDKIVKNLKKLNDCQMIEQFLTNPINVQKNIQEIKKTLMDNIGMQRQAIETATQNNDFYEAVTMLEDFEMKYQSFCGLFEVEIMISEMKETLEKQRAKVIKDYENIAFALLILTSPRDLLQNIDRLSRKLDYHYLSQNLSSILQIKFKEEIRSEMDSKTSPYVKFSRLQDISRSTYVLNDKVKNMIEPELNLNMQRAKQQIKDFEYRLEQAINDKDLDALEEMEPQCYCGELGSLSMMNVGLERKMKQLLKNNGSALANKVRKYVIEQKIEEFIGLYKNIEAQLGSIKAQEIEKLSECVSKIFEDIVDKLKEQLCSKIVNANDQDKSKLLTQSLDSLKFFVSLTIKEPKICQSLIDNFDAKLELLVDAVFTERLIRRNKIIIQLKQKLPDFQQILELLEVIKYFDKVDLEFQDQMRLYFTKHNKQNLKEQLNSISSTSFESIKSKLTEVLNQHLQHLSELINNLINCKVQSQNDYQSSLAQINEELNYLNKSRILQNYVRDQLNINEAFDQKVGEINSYIGKTDMQIKRFIEERNFTSESDCKDIGVKYQQLKAILTTLNKQYVQINIDLHSQSTRAIEIANKFKRRAEKSDDQKVISSLSKQVMNLALIFQELKKDLEEIALFIDRREKSVGNGLEGSQRIGQNEVFKVEKLDAYSLIDQYQNSELFSKIVLEDYFESQNQEDYLKEIQQNILKDLQNLSPNYFIDQQGVFNNEFTKLLGHLIAFKTIHEMQDVKQLHYFDDLIRFENPTGGNSYLHDQLEEQLNVQRQDLANLAIQDPLKLYGITKDNLCYVCYDNHLIDKCSLKHPKWGRKVCIPHLLFASCEFDDECGKQHLDWNNLSTIVTRQNSEEEQVIVVDHKAQNFYDLIANEEEKKEEPKGFKVKCIICSHNFQLLNGQKMICEDCSPIDEKLKEISSLLVRSYYNGMSSQKIEQEIDDYTYIDQLVMEHGFQLLEHYQQVKNWYSKVNFETKQTICLKCKKCVNISSILKFPMSDIDIYSEYCSKLCQSSHLSSLNVELKWYEDGQYTPDQKRYFKEIEIYESKGGIYSQLLQMGLEMQMTNLRENLTILEYQD